MTDTIRQRAVTLEDRVSDLERLVSALVAGQRLTTESTRIGLARAKAADDRILIAVADEFCVSTAAIVSKRRDAHVCLARHVAIYLVRKLLGLSYPALSELFGQADHTSAMHSDRLVHRRRQVDPGFCARIVALEDRIREPPCAAAGPHADGECSCNHVHAQGSDVP